MSKLSGLEKELAELFKSSLDAEKLFYLGIQIGRELERDSVAEYASQYFEDRKTLLHFNQKNKKLLQTLMHFF